MQGKKAGNFTCVDMIPSLLRSTSGTFWSNEGVGTAPMGIPIPNPPARTAGENGRAGVLPVTAATAASEAAASCGLAAKLAPVAVGCVVGGW